MFTVLITGANRGIGLELVKTYLEKGDWHILAGCRNPDQADELNSLAETANDRVSIVNLDVTDTTSVANLRAEIRGKKLDLLINNAGIMGGQHQLAFDMDFDAWEETFRVNTMAPLRMVQTVIENLRLSDHATIATISSQMGALSLKGGGSYAYRSSKAAVNKVMKVLADELKDEGITVVLFHPGWVQTDMGGTAADITPQQSAKGIVKTLDNLSHKDTGRFLKWNGEDHDW